MRQGRLVGEKKRAMRPEQRALTALERQMCLRAAENFLVALPFAPPMPSAGKLSPRGPASEPGIGMGDPLGLCGVMT